MVSCFFALHFLFITFLIFLSISLSNGENANYTACSGTYSCGKLQNIGYPFWGDNRPKYCGIPELMLNCYTGEGHPYTIMNVIRNYNKYVSYSALTVLAINTHSNTMSFLLKNRFNTCYVQSPKGVALLQTLKPDSNTRNITLFYSCNHSLIDISFSRNQHFYAFNCSNIDYTNGSAYYFVQQSDISKMAKSALCRNHVTFLVNKRGLDELKRTSYSSLSVLTEWPVTMNYTANFSACSECKKSGGRCGSSGDLVSYTSTFLCYCRDGQQPSVCQNHKKKISGSLALVLGTGGAILVLVGVVSIIVFWQHKKRKVGHPKLMTENDSFNCSASEVEKGSIYLDVPLFSYSELIEATDNFDQSKELGTGGHGTVYYGRLTDGREIAVKRLCEKNCERVQQFINEVQILTRMKHPNLVTLYGCSSQHCRELLLVYEYVKNGTVADHLSGKNTKSGSLPWPVRLRIANETAAALSYLHASGIIHRDVKTNNILLDCNFSVKVADFGLSRLFPNVATHVSTAPQGTPGYVDPEYSQCYQLTDKSDVYSFGVVLIELISSMPAVDMDRHRHEINLSSYAMKRIKRCAFDELVDPQLGFALDFKVTRMTTLVAELAFRYLQHDKDFRPSMDDVLETLRSIESIDYEALEAEEMANSETLQAEETYQNAQTEDCEVLETEKTAKYAVVKGVEMCFSGSSNTRTSTEDDHALLLRNFRQYSSSPSSVMENWVSGSTTSSICK